MANMVEKASQVRYVNELIEEIGLPPMALDFLAIDETGSQSPTHLALNPKLLDFLIHNEKTLKRQIKRDGGVKEAPASQKKLNIKPLYSTIDELNGVGIITPEKNNELKIYYLKKFPSGGWFVPPFERFKIWLKTIIHRICQPKHPSKSTNNPEISDLSNFTRFSDEPKDSDFSRSTSHTRIFRHASYGLFAIIRKRSRKRTSQH